MLGFLLITSCFVPSFASPTRPVPCALRNLRIYCHSPLLGTPCNKTGRWPALFLTLSLTLWQSLHYITLLYITLGRSFISLLYSTLPWGGLFITLHYSTLLETLFFTLLCMCALYGGRWWSLLH